MTGGLGLRALHRASACVVGAFAAVHLVNHLVGLAGIDRHVAFMQAARLVYRQPVLEALLLACVAFQAASGLWLVAAGWRARRGRVARLQAGSGAYLAFFLVVHVGAVLFGRAVLGLDTRFHFAAAGLHVPPFQWFFAPYYGLAVFALFAHLGCAAWWRWERRPRKAATLLALALGTGALIAVALVLLLAGRIHAFEVGACQGSCRLIHATRRPLCSPGRQPAWVAGSRSGLSVTTSMRCQLRVLPDQRRGLRSRACW